ncbi:MAG: L-glyceraldehyde 3-phosphate reductase [Victivallaceae bacterium]|nr:L-glyceraldehyde 3-phosphate reductase [Victivallaceae bacterium]
MATKIIDERYDTMQYNRCGNSGLKLSALSLGLWHNFGDGEAYNNAEQLIYTAFNLGITHFDLANNYGPPPGSAEKTFGRILKNGMKKYRDEMVISTKAGYLMWPGPYGEWGSRKNLLSSLDQSLSRMGLDYVDIFYSHRFDPETPLEETMGALTTAVQQGKALYVGISSYQPEDASRAIKILKGLGIRCLIHQPSYSIMNRWVEAGLLDLLEEKGVGAIAFCPLAQGLLTSRYLNGIPADSRAAKPGIFLKREGITEELVGKVKRLNTLAEQRGQTLAQMALSWILKDNRITSVLIGASRVSQLEENVKALDNCIFTQSELNAIDAAIE